MFACLQLLKCCNLETAGVGLFVIIKALMIVIHYQNALKWAPASGIVVVAMFIAALCVHRQSHQARSTRAHGTQRTAWYARHVGSQKDG